MSTKTIFIGNYEVGTIFDVEVDFVKNNGPDIASGVLVTLNIPTGLSYSSSDLSQGSYDSANDRWSVGSLIPGQSVNGTFSFEITDDCQGPYTATFTTSVTSGCDSCFTNNQLTVITSGMACCDVRACVAHPVVRTITASSYDAAASDEVLLVDSSSNAVTINLPAEATAYDPDTNKSLADMRIKVIDNTNGVTVSATGKIVDNTTIAGASTTYNFAFVGDAIQLVTDGTNWFVI